MLQDLAYGRLENEYRPTAPRADDFVLCFRGGDVLLHRHSDDTLTLPTADLFPHPLRYAFRLHDRSFYLFSGENPDPAAPFAWEPVRTLRQSVSMDICYAIMTGWHLYNWYRTNRLCGCCGMEMNTTSGAWNPTAAQMPHPAAAYHWQLPCTAGSERCNSIFVTI